jgi:hypothetical protein
MRTRTPAAAAGIAGVGHRRSPRHLNMSTATQWAGCALLAVAVSWVLGGSVALAAPARDEPLSMSRTDARTFCRPAYCAGGPTGANVVNVTVTVTRTEGHPGGGGWDPPAGLLVAILTCLLVAWHKFVTARRRSRSRSLPADHATRHEAGAS